MPVFVFAVTPDRLRAGVLQPFSKAVWQVCHHIGYLEPQSCILSDICQEISGNMLPAGIRIFCYIA
jgi:hypothetical protein